MLKIKTRKAVVKRFKKLFINKYLYKHAFKGHLLSKKTNAQKRNLSKQPIIFFFAKSNSYFTATAIFESAVP